MKKNNHGFTLVELVVVVVILVVLSTIGFIAYESYLVDTRDSKRLSQMNNLRDALRLHITKGSLPIPDDPIELRQDGEIYSHQGYAGLKTLETISFNENTVDPLDDSYYTYFLSFNRRDFQILGYLEEPVDENFLFQSDTFAFSAYEKRIPQVYGKGLGVLIESDTLVPVQELEPYKSLGYLDLFTASGVTLEAVVNNTKSYSGDPESLLGLVPFTTCKKLLFNGATNNGIYIINPTGKKPFQAYCDMETDGGGWTFTTFLSTFGGNYELFTGGASQSYLPDRSPTVQSYGLDITKIPHSEYYFVRGENISSSGALADKEVLNIQVSDYRKPLFNIPYSQNTTYGTRIGFTGEYLPNTARYMRDSEAQYYEICLYKGFYKHMKVCLREDQPFGYMREADREDIVFYDLTLDLVAETEGKNVWFYVR